MDLASTIKAIKKWPLSDQIELVESVWADIADAELEGVHTKIQCAKLDELVLMSAFLEGARPGSRYHFCGPVVRRALEMAALWNARVAFAYHADKCHPAIEACYDVIIRMTRHKPRSRALMEGQGNFGSKISPPAYPNYTVCRLRPRGELLARRLLKNNPEYQEFFF